MRSRTESNFDDFEATVSEALKRLSVTDITAKSTLGKWAVEFLKIEEQLNDLQQPMSVTGVAKEAIRQVQSRLDKQSELEREQDILLSDMLSEGAAIFAEALVAHLTRKKGWD